jgi:CheY-like chemotaxis protein/nitrogen-specific signal transduction histidine kinase
VSRDVTERKQVEEALRASEAETRRAKEDAERANQAKSDFLARMSHELRTPLHAILGFGELLAREGLPPGQREKLAQINTGANHLLTLINEALDVAAIERGELRLSLEPVHVGEVLGEALEMVAPLAAARSLTIEVPPAGEADVCVMADRQRLKQALLNFLSNAVKYNLERGTITVLCAAGEPVRLRIAVADTGVGINAERLTRVFEPFDRLGAETTDVHGTGLGLALTKQVIEAMNGEVGAESEIGLGTTLWLELSVVDVAPEEPPPPAPPPAIPSAGARAEERTVLYIEDNPSNVRLVETILADRPEITLLGAAQGSLGLELVREHRPSLVLLDLNLPDMSGEDVLRGIRSDPNTSAIPVVVLTADARTGQAARLRSAGADDFVTKPFSFTQLLEVIDGLSRSG